MFHLRRAALLLALLAGLTGCGGSDDPEERSTTEPPKCEALPASCR